jgi:hypothetical protein
MHDALESLLKKLVLLLRTDKGKRSLLVALISVLSVGSGTTTIAGAQQIMPSEGMAVIVGLAIQTLLFLFLANLTPRNFSTLVKSFLVFVLLVASIYTSFFSYYNMLSGKDAEARGYDYAAKAHNNLVATVYTPLKNKLAELKSQTQNFEAQTQREIRGVGVTGQIGRGNEANNYAQKVVDTQAKIADLEPTVNRLKTFFEVNIKNSSPLEILDKDRAALKEVPYDRLPTDYKISDVQSKIKGHDYVKEDSSSKFLLPYYRIIEGDSSAYAALAMASIVDFLALSLGMGIDHTKRRNKPFELIAISIDSFVMGFKNLLATFKKTYSSPGNAYIDSSFLRDDLPEYVALKLKGKGSEFLEDFLASTDIITRKVDINKIRKHENPTFKAGFIILFNALRMRQWIVQDTKGSFQIPEHCSQDFYIWISDVINDQIEHEETLRNITTFSQSIREIRINMPEVNMNMGLS